MLFTKANERFGPSPNSLNAGWPLLLSRCVTGSYNQTSSCMARWTNPSFGRVRVPDSSRSNTFFFLDWPSFMTQYIHGQWIMKEIISERVSRSFFPRGYGFGTMKLKFFSYTVESFWTFSIVLFAIYHRTVMRDLSNSPKDRAQWTVRL